MSDVFGVFTFDDAVRAITEVGGNDPANEAQELLNCTRVNDCDLGYFEELVSRRVEHEPVAYITGHHNFRGLDLFIDERVLIPRVETEPLVEEAKLLPWCDSVIDVGTGSGAIALAVKNERPDLTVLGTDISKDALDVAAINSDKLGINVEWRHADLLEGIEGEFGAVLANMPYLPAPMKESYAPEMTEHEPPIALWGGLDGYDIIRMLLQQAAACKSIYFIALEIGLGQEKDVMDLVGNVGFKTVYGTTDSRGDIRAIVGKR
jgi:release factor glutamine methyltransferase